MSPQAPQFTQYIVYECKEKENEKIKIKIQTIKTYHQENYFCLSFVKKEGLLFIIYSLWEKFLLQINNSNWQFEKIEIIKPKLKIIFLFSN